jgi:hypothetical protein
LASQTATFANSVTNGVNELPAKTSPRGSSSGSPAVVETDCDSTTHLNTMAPPTEQEEERESAKGDKTSEEVVLRYYSARYVTLPLQPSLENQTRHSA